jgi:hypothetical protein
MVALLDKASEVMDIPIDTSELHEVATDFEHRVNDAMGENEDFVQYVHRLEHDATPEVPIDPSRGAHLITEIEDFLKGR